MSCSLSETQNNSSAFVPYSSIMLLDLQGLQVLVVFEKLVPNIVKDMSELQRICVKSKLPQSFFLACRADSGNMLFQNIIQLHDVHAGNDGHGLDL